MHGGQALLWIRWQEAQGYERFCVMTHDRSFDTCARFPALSAHHGCMNVQVYIQVQSDVSNAFCIPEGQQMSSTSCILMLAAVPDALAVFQLCATHCRSTPQGMNVQTMQGGQLPRHALGYTNVEPSTSQCHDL